jgi:SAM-dependent methyltransferase
MSADSAHYPLERRQGEIERLTIQARALVFDTEVMLDRIGVNGGWACLDNGCGPTGITDLLSRRVGRTGRVVGLDGDAAFLHHARVCVPNAEFVEGNAYNTGLPEGAFDLVHVRFLAGTAGREEALIAETVRLARDGGIVAFQEPDMETVNCNPPHPAFARLKVALIGAFASAGADINIGKRLFGLARSAGLRDVQYRPFLLGFRSVDPLSDYLPSTVESLRGTILSSGLMTTADLDEALGECRAHLLDDATVSNIYTVAQVWGRVERAKG